MKFYLSQDYQSKCRQSFEIFKKEILALIPKAKVEHIGSSAVKGLISKGDLDIYVEVPELELEATIPILETIGFFVKQDTLRTPHLCMLEHHTENCAIQLVAAGSMFKFFLTFRDALQQSEQLRQQYNTLKQKCVDYDEDQYRQVKSNFIESVLNKLN